MVKEFVKDCDEMGFMSSWKLTQSIKKAAEDRKKEIKKVSSNSKDKAYKKKELLYTIDELHKDFDALTPDERREKGRALVQDIVDYGFLKEFTKAGNVEVSADESGDKDQRMVKFPKLKDKDWNKESTLKAPKRILNPILDPIDITKLNTKDKKRWEEVLNYLYNELPEDEEVMSSLLTKEQQDMIDNYRRKKPSASTSKASKVNTPPTNVASLSIGLTRFSFYLTNQMSHIAKRATRHHLFQKRR